VHVDAPAVAVWMFSRLGQLAVTLGYYVELFTVNICASIVGASVGTLDYSSVSFANT